GGQLQWCNRAETQTRGALVFSKGAAPEYERHDDQAQKEPGLFEMGVHELWSAHPRWVCNTNRHGEQRRNDDDGCTCRAIVAPRRLYGVDQRARRPRFWSSALDCCERTSLQRRFDATFHELPSFGVESPVAPEPSEVADTSSAVRA